MVILVLLMAVSGESFMTEGGPGMRMSLLDCYRQSEYLDKYIIENGKVLGCEGDHNDKWRILPYVGPTTKFGDYTDCRGLPGGTRGAKKSIPEVTNVCKLPTDELEVNSCLPGGWTKCNPDEATQAAHPVLLRPEDPEKPDAVVNDCGVSRGDTELPSIICYYLATAAVSATVEKMKGTLRQRQCMQNYNWQRCMDAKSCIACAGRGPAVIFYPKKSGAAFDAIPTLKALVQTELDKAKSTVSIRFVSFEACCLYASIQSAQYATYVRHYEHQEGFREIKDVEAATKRNETTLLTANKQLSGADCVAAINVYASNQPPTPPLDGGNFVGEKERLALVSAHKTRMQQASAQGSIIFGKQDESRVDPTYMFGACCPVVGCGQWDSQETSADTPAGISDISMNCRQTIEIMLHSQRERYHLAKVEAASRDVRTADIGERYKDHHTKMIFCLGKCQKLCDANPQQGNYCASEKSLKCPWNAMGSSAQKT